MSAENIRFQIGTVCNAFQNYEDDDIVSIIYEYKGEIMSRKLRLTLE